MDAGGRATQEAKAEGAQGEGLANIAVRTAHPTRAIELAYRRPSAHQLELAASPLNNHAYPATLMTERP